MTVSAVGFSGPTWIQTPGNDSATVFNFPFLITAATDLAVGFIVGEVYTQITSGYSVPAASIGNSGGGQVIFTAPPALGTTVDIRSQIPETQPTNFANLGAYYPENTTNAFDRAVRQIADLYRLTYAFGIHGPDQENTVWPALPAAASRAGGALVFDANGLPGVGVLTSTALTQSLFNGFLTANSVFPWPITAVESMLLINPTSYQYPEGDIRRYGASLASNLNHFAINTALLISAAGGSACYIPPGTWAYTSTLVTGNGSYGASSMYGAGRSSILSPIGVDGITFVADPLGGAESSRFFRDFQIYGPSSTLSSNNGITHNIASGRNAGIQFSNLTIQNFAKAVDVEGASGLWQSSFTDCFFYNNYQGYYLNGQVSVLDIRGGFVQTGIMTGTGTRYGIYTNYNSGGNVQSLHLQAAPVYGYDVAVSLNINLYTTITDCDLSNWSVTGIQVNGCQGGTFIKGCWIQANPAVAAALTGIQFADNSAALPNKVVVDSNHLVGNGWAGSVGIYCGTFWQATSIIGNTIGVGLATGFTYGISGPGAPGANSANLVCRDNTFYVTSTAITLYTNCSGAVIGPNVIQNGIPIAFSGGNPTLLTYTHANTPMTGALTFTGQTSQSVTFTTALPLASYSIAVTPQGSVAPPAWFVNGASVSGFTVNFASAFTGAVYWSIRIG
jgi:hypothetical protein